MECIEKREGLINKVIGIFLEYIMPYGAGFLVLVSLLLQYGVKKYMGFQRDLIYRNGVLSKTILSPDRLKLYQWIMLLGIGICLTIYIVKNRKIVQNNFNNNLNNKLNNKNMNVQNKLMNYLIRTTITSTIGLLLTFYYNKAPWIAYPVTVLTTLILIITQYIRVIYVGYCCNRIKY